MMFQSLCPSSDLPLLNGGGFCSLPVNDQHTLESFVTSQPPRAMAEFLIEVARDGLTLSEMLRRAQTWRGSLTPSMLRAAGGDHFPPRGLREVPR